MFKKNEEISILIDDLGNEGEGIGHIDGFPFFIKGTVPGDRVRAKVMKVKKNLGFARLISVLSPSENRIEPECPVSGKCGGCSLQHVSREEELRYKDRKVFNCLKRIGGIPEEALLKAKEPVEGAEDPFRYRNKAQYPVGRGNDGKAAAGFYSGRSHRITENEDCLLSPPEFGEILRLVLDHIDENKISVYDEEEGTGLIRHVFIRKGFGTGEIMVCLVSTSFDIPYSDKLAEKLMAFPGVVSVMVDLNPDKTNVILGSETKCLAGKPYIEDILCGLRFRISPLSFYQVNPVIAEKLYLKAMEYAGLKGDDSGPAPKEIWDICCGIGTIALTAASLSPSSKVMGVEISPEAIGDAKVNADINGLKNAEFFAAPAETFLPEYYSSHPEASPEVVIADPPRKGLDKEVLDTLISLSPERIVYISCDPATLARDLKILLSSGYDLKKYRVFDQFSRTGHVEVVVMLSRAEGEAGAL